MFMQPQLRQKIVWGLFLLVMAWLVMPMVTSANSMPSFDLVLNGPSSVLLDETFQVDVVAQNVPEPGLYGVQFEVDYNPNLVSVDNLQLNPNLVFVVVDNIDAGNGKITLVASQQGQVDGLTGDVTLLSFDVTANASGSASFDLMNAKMSDHEADGFGVLSSSYTVNITAPATPTSLPTDPPPVETPTPETTNTPSSRPTVVPTSEPTDTPTSVPTSEPTSEPADTPTSEPATEPTSEPTSEPTAEPTDEITPEPTPVSPLPTPTSDPNPTVEPVMVDISGQVILTGRINDDWSGATITVDNGTQSAVTESNGNFMVENVSADGLNTNANSIIITADAPGYLSAVCAASQLVDPATVLVPVALVSGDINGDNLVDITDAAAVGVSFDKTGADLPADITRDGVVDIFDIVLVGVNFGEAGPQTWACAESPK
jgi:hypothetical protein